MLQNDKFMVQTGWNLLMLHFNFRLQFIHQISNPKPMKKLVCLLSSVLMLFLYTCSLEEGMTPDPAGDVALKAAHGVVINLSPSPDGDDTEELIAAFEAAQAAGKGAVVELQDGTFEIGMIEVKEFFGTLRGLGKGVSIITNLPDLTPDAALAADKLPALITFIGGEVTVSELSVLLSEGLDWLGTVDMSMLLFSDYSADFMPAKKHIGVDLNNIDVTGLLIPDVELWPDGPVIDIPYNLFNGVMLAPDKQDAINPISRSNIDVSVSNSTFSKFSRGLYVHGCLAGNLDFGTKGGNLFTSNNQGLVVNENIGVHVKIENNEFNTPRYYWNCIDLNTSETVFGWQQFEDALADPGTYEVRNNILNTKALGIGMMDTWRWVHPENPTWMKISVQNNTFNLSDGAAIMDFYCAKNVQFKNNVINGDGSFAGFWVENFWWEPTIVYNSSDGVKILNNYFLNQTVDFWFWAANNCMLMGDLSNFIVNDFGENNKILGKTNYGHSNEKFLEQATARQERLLEKFTR
jgi:hypothetical protein